MICDTRLGAILIELGVLTPAEVSRVATAQSRRGDPIKFGQLAKDLGILHEEHILAALAVQMGIVPMTLQRSIRKVLGELKGPGPKSPLPFPLESVQKRLRK